MGLIWVGPIPATSVPFLWHLLGFFILKPRGSEIKFPKQAVVGGEDLPMLSYWALPALPS